MNVKEIVVKFLKDNGYDGLVSEDAACGCEIDDIICDEIPDTCKPAYKILCKSCPVKECENRNDKNSLMYCMFEKKPKGEQ